MATKKLIEAFWSATPMALKKESLPWFTESITVKGDEIIYTLLDQTPLCRQHSDWKDVLNIQVKGRGYGFTLKSLNMILARTGIRLTRKRKKLIIQDTKNGLKYLYSEPTTIDLKNRAVLPCLLYYATPAAEKLKAKYAAANHVLETTQFFAVNGLLGHKSLVCFRIKGRLFEINTFIITLDRADRVEAHFGQTNLLSIFNAAKTRSLDRLLERTNPMPAEDLPDWLADADIDVQGLPARFRSALAIHKLVYMPKEVRK